jgi:RNA polymerase sigma-70 factor, ECF subfamily
MGRWLGTRGGKLYVNLFAVDPSNIDERKNPGYLEMMPAKAVDVDLEIDRIEPEDFDWIVLQHQKRIYRILLSIVRDSDVADTLTQECFLRAFKKRSGFRGESSLFTWLVSIAINLARDHSRNRRWAFWRTLSRIDRLDAIRTMDAHHSPEQTLINRERIDLIQSAIETLSDRQRTIFLLRFVEDLPLEMIAESMGLKLGTVKSHLFRATEAVKSAYKRR